MHVLRAKSATERKLTVEVIELLEEVDRRLLHLEKGFGSLLEFCIKELCYSESAAYRRISAMRISRELPQVKKSIEAGSLNLATVSQAQTFFQQEKRHQAKVYSKSEKLVVLQSLENKSKREAEKILLEKSPDLPKLEVVRQVSKTHTRVTINIDQELLKKLDQLKNIYSHINPNPSYAELIQLMATELLKVREKKIGKLNAENVHRGNNVKKNKDQENKDQECIFQENKDQENSENAGINSCSAKPPAKAQRSRHIPQSVRRFIYQRDHGCCSYQDIQTQKKCNSKFQLEIDHIKPFSWGGPNDANNLRLVCRQHNKFFWQQG